VRLVLVYRASGALGRRDVLHLIVDLSDGFNRGRRIGP
jgi:hypothetical protein